VLVEAQVEAPLEPTVQAELEEVQKEPPEPMPQQEELKAREPLKAEKLERQQEVAHQPWELKVVQLLLVVCSDTC
jgi:hypothetical protein